MASEQQQQPSAPQEAVIKVEEKKLVVAFIQFLRQKVSSNECTDPQIEGLEVAVQCLESAFSLTDKNYAFQPAKPLLQLLVEAEGLKAVSYIYSLDVLIDGYCFRVKKNSQLLQLMKFYVPMLSKKKEMISSKHQSSTKPWRNTIKLSN